MSKTKFFCKIILFILVLHAKPSISQELTAIDLQKYCKEVQRGSVGKYYNQISAQKCNSYMSGFFDSMIVLSRFINGMPFCVPEFLPKTQNTTILDEWIKKNKSTAETTTAAVALYAAFKIAFPCQ